MDVSALLQAAERIDELAATLRARAALIGLHAATTHWYSPASRAYFARLDDVTGDLTRCAARMNAVAELARRHAAIVRMSQ